MNCCHSSAALSAPEALLNLLGIFFFGSAKGGFTCSTHSWALQQAQRSTGGTGATDISEEMFLPFQAEPEDVFGNIGCFPCPSFGQGKRCSRVFNFSPQDKCTAPSGQGSFQLQFPLLPAQLRLSPPGNQGKVSPPLSARWNIISGVLCCVPHIWFSQYFLMSQSPLHKYLIFQTIWINQFLGELPWFHLSCTFQFQTCQHYSRSSEG